VRRKRHAATLVAVLAITGLLLAGVAVADTDGSGDGSPWPANTNPSKTPVTEAPPAPAEEPDPLADRIEAAKTYLRAAKDDTGLIVCLTPTGTLAGTVEVDRPPSAPPFTAAEKQATCEQAFPGSHS
jgi:hypothetical protein